MIALSSFEQTQPQTPPADERFSEEIAPDVITVTYRCCGEKAIYSTRGASRAQIERDKREHVCEVRP
jgi:hypothetical protein